MYVVEKEINCSGCGKKLGLLSKVYIGVPHDTSNSMACIDCLPNLLDEAEKKGYKPEVIERVRKWLKEP